MTTSQQSRLGDAPEEGIKAPVVTVSTGNQALFGIGQTIASVVIADQDRVALAAQTDPTENGIWVARGGKSWVRATDMNNGEDVADGQLITDSNTQAVYSITSSVIPWFPGTDIITFGLLLSPVGFFWGAITGTVSNQADLQAELDAKSAVVHTHTESDITDLGNYSLIGHTHVEADITDLQKYTLVGHTHVEADITDLQAYLTDAPVNSELYARSNGIWQVFTTAAGTIGEILLWAHEDVPQNFLECDGQSVNAVTFAKLFAIIGYQYGGSGADFNLPDLRGEFVRGYDHGAAIDPDRAARTDRGDGTTGDEIGTKQAEGFKSHTHQQQRFTGGPIVAGVANNTVFTTNPTTGAGLPNVISTGGNETRPRNVQMMYMIRYDGGGSGTLPPQVQVQDNGVTITPAVELLNFINFNLESLVANQVDIGFGASQNNATYCPNYSFTFIDTVNWRIAGANAANLFSVGRRLRFVDGASNYFGTISTVAFVAGNTNMLMTMEGGDVLTNTITEVCLVNGGVSWSPISGDPFGGDSINGIDTGTIGSIEYWVAVGDGGKLFVSIDGGLSWASRVSHIALNLNDVAYNPDDESFLVVGDGAVLIHSVDTTTWTLDITSLKALPEYTSGNADVHSVAYDIAGRAWRCIWELSSTTAGSAYSFDDAVTWASTPNFGNPSLVGLAKMENHLLTGGLASNGTIYGNGQDTYTFGAAPDESGTPVVNLSSEANATALLSFIDPVSGTTVKIWNAHADGKIFNSTVDMDDVTFGVSVVHAFAYSATHDRFVAVADDGKIGYLDRDDAPTFDSWTLVDNGANPLADFTDVAWNEVNGIFCAVNNQGQILRSSNGLGINVPVVPFTGWTAIAADPFSGGNIDHIATGVIAGVQWWVIAGSTLIYTSTDAGITWTARTSGVTGAITALQYDSSNENFVVGCANGDFSITTNGTTWVADTTTVQAIPALLGSGAINGLIWSPSAGLWAAFIEYNLASTAMFDVTFNMVTWTISDITTTGAGQGMNNTCVYDTGAAGRTIYTGLATLYEYYADPTDTSPNSLNNMNTPITAGLGKAGTLTFPQDLFMGDSDGDIELMSLTTVRAVNDGAMNGPVNAFAYTSVSDRMVAVGDAGEIKTQAGIDLDTVGTWVDVVTPFGGNINDVDYNASDDTFICVCSDGVIARSVDGIS